MLLLLNNLLSEKESSSVVLEEKTIVLTPSNFNKISEIELDGVVEKSNIDAVIAPHRIASDQIVQYVRAMENSGGSSCEAIYNHENIFEMVEFTHA